MTATVWKKLVLCDIFKYEAELSMLFQGLLTEMRLRQRIAELKEYRRSGIHTLNEADVYEAEKRRRCGIEHQLLYLQHHH